LWERPSRAPVFLQEHRPGGVVLGTSVGVGFYTCTTEERLMRFRTLRVPAEWNQMFLEQQISGLVDPYELYPYEPESRFRIRFQLQKTWKCS
jgi:hypothetical protein